MRSLLLLVVLTPAIIFASELPNLGSEFRSTMSVNNERLLGTYLMGQVRSTGLVYSDPLINEYVQYLGNQLTPFVDMPYANIQIKFFVLNDKTINAFAFPGGHIGIHSQLILLTGSEHELAGIMAHELAHISQQHVLRQQTDNNRMMPATIVGSIAAAALGVPELLLPVFAGHMQVMLNYSRQHEQEADRMGTKILAKANFDPHGLSNALERMNSDSRYQSKPPEYLLTHPLHDTRIADLRDRAGILTYKRRGPSYMFDLIKARIEVQTTNSLAKLISEYEHKLKDNRFEHDLGLRYRYAYALCKKSKFKQSLDLLSQLSTEYPDDMIIQLTTAEVEMEDGQFVTAQKRLERLLATYPDSHSLLVQYIELLIYTKQTALAQKMLNKYKKLHTPDPIYYEQVRQVEGILGNKTAIYEANAEWYLLHSDTGSALAQLDLALGLKNNDQKTIKRIKNRQQQISNLQQQIKKEL